MIGSNFVLGTPLRVASLSSSTKSGKAVFDFGEGFLGEVSYRFLGGFLSVKKVVFR